MRATRVIGTPAAFFLFAAGVVVGALLLAGCGDGGTAPTETTSGATSGTAAPGETDGPGGIDLEAAPEFAGTTLDGEDVSLEGFRGRPLILAFWASW